MTQTLEVVDVSEQHHNKRIPVIELFGPTIQGEGLLTGTLSSFLRTGGCPLKCSWCDSMHAVDPEQVKANASWLTVDEIIQWVLRLPAAPYITFSGGDPCIWSGLGDMIIPFNSKGIRVAVETQGTHMAEWLGETDVITFSPKPPSSGNPVDVSDMHEWLIYNTTPSGRRHNQVCIKVVVFDLEDFKYAIDVYRRIPDILYDAFYFTAGTSVVAPKADDYDRELHSIMRAQSVLTAQRRVADMMLNAVRNAPGLLGPKVHLGVQQHVLLWPHVDQGV